MRNDPQELKSSILQLAIQGKLVEQRPEDGTAEELCRQIQKENQALAKARKNQEKPLPEIAEDEKPFDIPESWKWVRMGNCSSYAQSKEEISPDDILSKISKARPLLLNRQSRFANYRNL